MILPMRAINHTLLVDHVSSREEVLGANLCTSKLLQKDFRWTLATFGEFPSFWTSYTVHYAVFHGTNSVIL